MHTTKYYFFLPRLSLGVDFREAKFPDDFSCLGSFGEGLTRTEGILWFWQFVQEFSFLRDGRVPAVAVDQDGHQVAATQYVVSAN